MNPPPPPTPRELDRQILALALPALGALAADPLVSMVDTAFVGRLGVVPLAAIGVNTSIFSLAFVVFNFLAYGTTPRVARALGGGDRAGAGRTAVQALVLAAGVGIAATVLLETLAGPIVRLMGARGELTAPALAYLRIRALAGPAVLLITAGHGIFRGYQDTRTPMILTFGLNAVNLVLDPLFIFRFGWGLEGAAIASAVAQWSGALGFIGLLLLSRRTGLGIVPSLPRPRDLLPLLRVGGTLALRTFALISTLSLATAVATRIGTLAVAAHQVASLLWLMLALIVDSLAVAAQAMVARYRGSGEPRSARAAAHRLLLWGGALGVALGLFFFAIGTRLPQLFTSDPGVLKAAGKLLPFVVWMQPLNALVFVWDGIFLGEEAFRFVAGQMVLAAAVASTVLLLVIPLGGGLAGVWWGIVTLMVVRAATLARRYFSATPAPTASR